MWRARWHSATRSVPSLDPRIRCSRSASEPACSPLVLRSLVCATFTASKQATSPTPQNDAAPRRTIVRGRSTHVALPERATVLVTEMLGNDPLDEEILEIVADARERLLMPGARIIPSDVEVHAFAVDIPRKVFERHV